MKSVIERFERLTVPEPNSGCLLWLGAVNARGYGVFRYDGRSALAHRVSWTLANGTIHNGMCVLHRCDVRTCVRSSHLFEGTEAENSADMVAKHRNPRGEGRWNAKLNGEQVTAIRIASESQAALARAYGVSPGLIRDIVTRKTWKHIGAEI